MANELTDKQQRYITALYELDTNEFKSERARQRQAARLAGYSDETKLVDINSSIPDEVFLQTASRFAASQLPRTMINIANIQEGKHSFEAGALLKAGERLSDIAGLIKKDKLVIEHNVNMAYIELPAKKEIDKESSDTVIIDVTEETTKIE